MAWRRTKRSEHADDAGAGDLTDADPGATRSSGSTGVDPLLHDLVADDAVLIELSEAFAESESPGKAPSAGPAGAPSPRKTIIIGGDDALDDVEIGSDRGGADRVADRVADDASPRNIISIGGSDDLPDAVYLDDELEQDIAGADAVFIDDDGSADAVLPHVASGRGIEPRIRQRRIGVKRAESRRRLWWVAVGAAVLVVVIAVLALLGSSLFAVEDVTVTGNVYTDAEALGAIIDDLEGTPVLRVNVGAFEARLEDLPWVERARVRTDFPNAASVEIVERTPVAAMEGVDGQSRVLDRDGRVLALVDGQPVTLAWLAGTGTLDVGPGEFAPPGPAAAASLVTKLTPNVRSRLEYLLVTPDGGDLVLLLNDDRGPIEVRFGSALGNDVQIEKLVRLERTLDGSADRPVAVIDVSTSEVTVR